jgi:hypothetical protein
VDLEFNIKKIVKYSTKKSDEVKINELVYTGRIIFYTPNFDGDDNLKYSLVLLDGKK